MGLRKGKKNKAPAAPAPGLPLPPLPGMPPMPAPPGAAAALPAAPLPPAPAPAALPAAATPLPAAPAPTADDSVWNSAPSDAQKPADDKYGDLWAKRSEKPLPQIYGHIDRISSGDAGSLLDRYADRFGHALDRDIIVLRKKEHEDKVSEVRDAPVVELLDDKNDTDLATQLSNIEDELRSLKPEYQAAKQAGDAHVLGELRPVLESLMAERKALQAMMSGGSQEASTAMPVSDEAQAEDDMFVTFVSIVDELLGSNLASEVIEAFVASEDFATYEAVGSDPSNADQEMRSAFFTIVDGQLGNMEQEDIDAFVASDNFEIYSAIGAQYQ